MARRWSFVPIGKKREGIPRHVFARQGSRKYPYKVKRGGRWVISRAGVEAALRRASQHGATDVVRKMRGIQRRKGWLPKGYKG